MVTKKLFVPLSANEIIKLNTLFKMNKIALITGATSGIGKATAEMIAELGYNLVITGRRAERLELIATEIKGKYDVEIKTLCFDIRDRAQTFECFNSLDQKWQNIYLLVNNAGLASGLEHIQEGDFEDWDRMIDTNIKGVLNITRIVTPIMAKNNSGHIINIGSIAGIQVYENGGVYCASKHALHALSQSMRIDMLKHGVRVSEVRPGMVNSEFSEVRFHGDTARAEGVYNNVEPLTPEDIAGVIKWIITLPEHVNINDIEVMPKAQASAHCTFRG